jgi:alpha-L-fucosidase
LRPGLYLSPWDRNHPAYGDSPRYNDVYIAQLTELLTGYGTLAEVWFDGANGEGPNGRKQEYDWPRIWATVRQLQPGAVMFSDAGPDVRWNGNENGIAGDPNWSSVDPARVPAPGVSGPGVIDALQHGDANGSVWRPAEADVSIRPGWFYHPAEDARVKTAGQLVNLYLRSVGRNSKLLLNVPPTPEGVLHGADVASLQGLHERLQAMFKTNLATGRNQVSMDGRVREVDLPTPSALAYVRLSEDIVRGQTVARYSVSGFEGTRWVDLSSGTTIGYAKIDGITSAVPVRRLKVTVTEATAAPVSVQISAYPPV